MVAASAVACGDDSSEPTATQEEQPTDSTDQDLSSGEDELRRTAQEAIDAFLDGDNAKFYTYYAEEYKTRCSLGDFLGLLALSRAFIGDLSDAEGSIGTVRFEEDRAFVHIEISLDGEELFPDEGEEDDEYWILEEGAWKLTSEDPNPCDLDFGDEAAATDTPQSTEPGSSRNNPAERGQSVRTPDGLEITILAVNLNAWTVVQAENQFNDPPAPGNRMILVRVRVTNISTGDETVTVSEGDLSLTGSRNVIYDTFSESSSCGVVPEALQGEMFPGGSAEGNVCFQVPADETGPVIVVDPLFSFETGNRRYLALDE